MPKGKVGNSEKGRILSTATTPEGRQNQLIALAYDCVEARIRNGTASAQELTQLLKLGTEQARLELEILNEQKKLVTAKTESLESSKRVEELYNNALNAMRRYSGREETDEY